MHYMKSIENLLWTVCMWRMEVEVLKHTTGVTEGAFGALGQLFIDQH